MQGSCAKAPWARETALRRSERIRRDGRKAQEESGDIGWVLVMQGPVAVKEARCDSRSSRKLLLLFKQVEHAFGKTHT